MLEELQSIAESLATRLQRSVAIDDARFRLLVHTPHRTETVDRYRVESIMQKLVADDAQEWSLKYGITTATAPVRIPANDDLGFVARYCMPVRCGGILLAYLWLLDAEGSVTGADLDQAMESANAAGEVLYREQLLGDLRRGRERELLRDLLASDSTVREHAAQQLVASDRLPEDARVAVLAVQVRPAESVRSDVTIDLALQRAERRLAPLSGIWATRGGANGLMLIAGRWPLKPDRLRAIAGDLHAELVAGVGDDATVRVGIGPVVPALERTHESHSCAQDALRVAAQVPGFAEVADWDALGIYRLLVQLPLDQLRDNAIPPGLLRLLEGDEPGVLVETLEVYLDEAGRAPAAIERLQIHRTSLYHRLNRIEQATGMSLSNGGDRLALHLGIKLARLIGLRPDAAAANRPEP